MPPLFPPRSNFIARASLIALPILVVAIVVGLVLYGASSAVTQVGVPVAQPVPFPHTFHVTAVKLDCRYCHASVDKSSFADLPPTETCMTCHSQILLASPNLIPVHESWESGQPIQWTKVNQLADFVFFNHEIHVNKGVGCETCHGRVDQMTTDVKENSFYMAWCLDCHRNPEKFLRPVEEVMTMGYQPAENQLVVGAKLVKDYEILPASQLINCSICHR
ncbi:MAG: cytochrome C [Chloroflexi bacterium 44-23]|nr:MAG: cytochrome C [Chloroflexi bacterium 44-23]